jgi:phage shock protein A
MEDSEFLSLDLESARNYALAWATTIKGYERDLSALDQELATWRSRVSLAEAKAQPQLADAARSRCAELEQRRQGLDAERAALASDLVRIKERIPYLKSKERSVDPDLLLAELQGMTGSLLDPEKAATDQQIEKLAKDAGTDDALAELKKRIGGQ